jgi:D-3-phosphoglycerate dehydrogenase
VARYLSAFEVAVVAADPLVREGDVEEGVRLVGMPELLETADLVTVHVNLTPATTNLMGKDEFALMRPGSWFVNTSRGEIVDDQALLQALRTGRLAGAAVDVVSGEHGPARTLSPLITYARRHNNLVVTPHIGGCTGESMEKTEIYMAQQVAKALAATQPGPVAAAGS